MNMDALSLSLKQFDYFLQCMCQMSTSFLIIFLLPINENLPMNCLATYVTGFDKTRLPRTKTEIHFIRSLT